MAEMDSKQNRGAEEESRIEENRIREQRQKMPPHGGKPLGREHNLDKTIEDSFPASDPPSTDPNPEGDE